MEQNKTDIEVLEKQANNGNVKSAKKLADELLATNKPKAMHFYALAADLGDKESLKIISKFLEENGDANNAKRARELSEKENKSSTLTLTGLALIKDSNYQKAEEFLRKAVVETPDDGEAWNALGLCYAMKRDFYSAHRSYSKAFELTKGSGSLKGMVLMAKELGRRDEAIQHCKQYRSMFNDGEVDAIYNELLETKTQGTQASNARSVKTINTSGTQPQQFSNTQRSYTPNPQYSNQYRRPVYNRRKTSSVTVVARWFIAILAIIGLLTQCTGASISPSSSTSRPSTPTASQTQSSASDPDANLTKISFSNGQIIKRPVDQRVAPLTIETSKSSSNSFYIYLEDITNGGKNNMAFMVKAGQTADVTVPLGTYRIYYATGETWYGSSHKFGADTYYCKCEGTFKFYDDGEYYIGHTLTLYAVSNGNLSTEKLNESSFPG